MLFAPQTISDANCKPAISADLPDEAVTDLTYPSQKACIFACAGDQKGGQGGLFGFDNGAKSR